MLQRRRQARSAPREQGRGGSERRYPEAGGWTFHGDRVALCLRILPLILVAVFAVLNTINDDFVWLTFVLASAPLLVALINGPVVTAVASVVAFSLLGPAATNPTHVEQTGVTLLRLSTIVLLYVLAVFFSWARGRSLRRLTGITEVAEVTQQAIVPDVPRKVGPYRIATFMTTPERGYNLVGGDFFSVGRSRGAVRLVLGDVQGHNMDTIMLTNVLMGAFSERVSDAERLEAVAVRMHERVMAVNRGLDDWDGRFATAVFAELRPDEGTARILACGHPAPLHLGEASWPVELRPLPPLGVSHTLDFSHHTVETAFEKGDMLHFFSDGLVEARNSRGETYPLSEAIAAYLAEGRTRDPEALVSYLSADFTQRGFTISDDVSALSVLFGEGEETPEAEPRLGMPGFSAPSRRSSLSALQVLPAKKGPQNLYLLRASA
ncbi:PP2C family protein-serine/threonine phosphatase [Salininema proteolyticum]|uniref:PP2C family protein-serine/threonine phosphatase n=1 Tax=Salininema proteolyticum TaxID=1607685 RepID=A0ABV8U5S8_9ACTN